jgi:hypothetical protein
MRNSLIPLLFLLTLVPLALIADDVIVDQSSLSQYQTDNCAQFDMFDFDGQEHNNTNTAERILLANDPVILGEIYTQEVWIYRMVGGISVQKIIGTGHAITNANYDLTSPPTILLTDWQDITYGFGNGGAAKFYTVEDVAQVNGWIHIAVTKDETNLILYINGEEVDHIYFSGGGTAGVPEEVGQNRVGHNFQGKMDNLRMWNLARTQEQIQQYMYEDVPADEPGLLANYTMDLISFDDGDWTAAGIPSPYKVIDRSPRENHGLVYNVEIVKEYFSDDCPKPDGSLNCPYPTINRALDDEYIFNDGGGARVHIREGRYSELVRRLGMHDLIIEGYPDEDVVIDGTVPVALNWEPYDLDGHSVFKAEIDFDSICIELGRPIEGYPGSGYQDTIYSVFVDDRYMIPASPYNYKNPTDPTIGNPENPEPGTVWSLGIPYNEEFIPSQLEYLDTLEEWAYDPSEHALYIYPSNNYIPDSTNVRVQIRERVMDAHKSENLQIKNLHFYSGSFFADDCNNLTIEDSKFSFSTDHGADTYNEIRNADELLIRNCVFENMGAGTPIQMNYVVYPTIENVLFRNFDWYKGNTGYAMVDRNFSSDGGDIEYGEAQWRYVTVKNSYSAGISPGYRSLVEYCRFENLYDTCDCSGIQRNGSSATLSTTRYCWIINCPHMNALRLNSGCGGNNADIHHVVSIGNRRNFTLKGDYHDAHHLTSYSPQNKDIILPEYKYCGLDGQGENEPGNIHSQLRNTMAQGFIDCNSPDCGGIIIDGSLNDTIPTSYDPFFLDSAGIWYGKALDPRNHFSGVPVNPYNQPVLGLENPWIRNRARSDDYLMEEFGTIPWENNEQGYDFRPRKGSDYIDNGVIISGINDGLELNQNHPPLYSGQNRAFVGDAPDIGAYEYGDSVYWIPGFRYEYPSVPLPKNGETNVSMEYGLTFNYPWKTDYSGTVATVTVSGPGVNRTETFQYPYNVLFETFQPGGTYNWSVTVDGISGGNWSFTVKDRVYPLNDRSVATATDTIVWPFMIQNLVVSNSSMAFLRFDIPSSVLSNCIINLNLVPENIITLNSGIIIYQYNFLGWDEWLDNETNIGVIDRTVLTPIDTVYSLDENSGVSIDISDIVNTSGEYSFALGVLDEGDSVSFYSKEKMYCANNYPGCNDSDQPGGAEPYAPQTAYWPSLNFQPQDGPAIDFIPDQVINEDMIMNIVLSASDINGYGFLFSASSSESNVTAVVIDDTLNLTPLSDWNGQTVITAVVESDGPSNFSDTTSFTFTVNAVNDSPVLTDPLPDVVIDEDVFSAVIIPAMESHFFDIDDGDILSYTASALGEGLDSLSFSTDDGFTAMASYHGSRIMSVKRSQMKEGTDINQFQTSQNRSKNRVNSDTRQNSFNSRTDSTALIVYPTENFVGDIDIIIIASDMSSISVADTLMLTIVNIGDAPIVINPIADIEVDEDNEPLTLNINGVFDDVDISVGDSLTITAISLADTLVTVEYDSNGVPLLVFSENGHGETDIIVTAADLIGLTANDTVHVTILSVNDAPLEFSLLSPADSTELVITPNDISQEMNLMMRWESSSDVDGDVLIYQFVLGVDGTGASVLIDTVLSDTVLNIPYQDLAEFIGMLGQTSISGNWTVFTTDSDDTTMSNDVWNILIDAGGVLSIHGDIIPEVYALHQNYPNPFNPTTILRYDLPEDTQVRITIYDIMGREIRTLFNNQQSAGYKSVVWDATNDLGQPVSAGMYLYRIFAEEFVQVKKMVLLK